LHYHTRTFVTARVTKVTNVFTATTVNWVTKTINVFSIILKWIFEEILQKFGDCGELEGEWDL